MDNISNLLTKIRNAQVVGKKRVEFSYSKMNEAILNLIADRGLISGVKIDEINGKRKEKKFKMIVANLKYKDEALNNPVIKALRQISKPGRRVYCKSKEIRKVLNGRGFGIYSTPKGLMTDKQAKEENLGGEYICEIWVN